MTKVWNRIITPEKESYFSADLEAMRENIVADIEDLERLRSEHDAEVQKLNSEPIDAFDPDDAKAQFLRANRIELLQFELRIRKELAEFYNLAYREKPDARRNAHVRFEELKADVEQRLVGIGYKPATKDPRQRIGSVRSEWILCHPEVIAARIHKDDIKHSLPSDLIQQNDEALNALERDLERYRDLAVV